MIAIRYYWYAFSFISLTVMAAQSFLGVTPRFFWQYSSRISNVNGREGNMSVTLVLPPGNTISVQA